MDSIPENQGKIENTPGISTEFSVNDYARCLLPSLLGLSLFLVPIKYKGHFTILLAVIEDLLSAAIADWMPHLLGGVLCISVLLSLILSLGSKRPVNTEQPVVKIFQVTSIWLILRILGLLVYISVMLDVGPEWIRSESTGGTVVTSLVYKIIVFFFLIPLMLPLLTDYGFMEFVGTLLGRPFQFLFRLPGRSAIDCLASWMAAASIGVILTARQYELGYYSQREATVIATNFSVVSLPFCYVIADVVKLNQLFLSFYGTVVFVGFIAAIITPRIPPLSRIPNKYNTKPQIEEESEDKNNLFATAIKRAVGRASKAPGIKKILLGGDGWRG